jgi:hypothetical protein
MAINKNVWEKARALYELGNSLSIISNQTGIDRSSISKRSKKDSWIQGEIQQLKNEKINAISGLVEIENKIQQQIQPHQIVEFNKAVDEGLRLKSLAMTAQEGMLELVQISTNQVKQLLNNLPDGLYVAGNGDKGVRYGRTTEFVKDLIPAMNAANAILGINNKNEITTNVQINNDAQQISINDPIEAAQVYQDLMKK